MLPEEAHYAADTFGKGFILGGGAEGFVDPVPRMNNVLRLFPWTNEGSKFGGIPEMESEFTDFISKYENIVYISFGTTFVPSNDTQRHLINAISENSNIGFIWSLKPKNSLYFEIEEKKYPNLLLKKFVP